MKTTRRILLPFNFTEDCVAALKYAVQYATYAKADLVLLHCAGNQMLTPTFQGHLMSRLRSFTDRHMAGAGSKIMRFCVVRSGFLPENLASVIENHQVDLLIASPFALLGQSGTDEVSSLAAFAACPVLLVPRQAVFRPIKHMVYPLNLHDTDPNVLARVRALAQPFGAEVTLLHLKGKLDALEVCQLQKKAEALKTQLDLPHTKVDFLEEEDLLEGLGEYTEDHPADLFVISTRDTHLLQQYFSGCYRKTCACHLHTPLLNLYQARTTACSDSCTHCHGDQEPQEKAQVARR